MGEIDYGRIRLLVLDVDGVMTDGAVTLDADGREIKRFHVRDGSGLKYWQRSGRQVAIISGRSSPAVAVRAKELGIEIVRQNCKDKLPVYEEVLREVGVRPDRVACVGDDVTDIPLLRRCALPVAVADAAGELREQAKYVTRLPGGAGCVREVVEMILKKAGDWSALLDRYFPEGRDGGPGGAA